MKKSMRRWLAVMLAVMTAVVFMPAMSLAVQQEDKSAQEESRAALAADEIPEGYDGIINIGDTVSPVFPDGEDTLVYKIGEADQDVAVSLSVTAGSGYVTADIYQMTGEDPDDEEDEGLAHAYYDEGDVESGVGQLQAGEDYYLLVWLVSEPVKNLKVSLTLNSVQKIEFAEAAPYEIYENCDGDWEEDEDGNVYYRYDEPSFRKGDTITLTDLKGNRTEYVYDEGECGFISKQDEDDVIDEDEVELDCSSQDEPGSHWEAPGDYYCKMEYQGLTCEFAVSIVASPVESVQFEPVEPIALGEETDGEWETDEDEDGVEHKWFRYDPLEEWFRTGDKLILKYRDEDQARTYVYKQLDSYDDYGEAEDGFVNSDDPADVLDDDTLEQMDDQKYNNQWEMGSSEKNYFYLSYLGTRSEKIPVTIKKGIGSAKITAKETFKYTGKVIKPAVKVVYTDKEGNKIELKKDQDYIVDYYFAINGVGEGNYFIQGIGEYAGKVWKDYDVKPLGTTLGKSKGARKALTVKWKAQKTKMYLGGSGQKARVDGYQIMIATDKKFKKNKKTVFVKGYKKTSTKIKKLKAKKTYYVKVRTRIDRWYYSDWSTVKKVKTK